MKRALCLNAVHPGIGGVLISGERGTAKTTAVRALADVFGASRGASAQRVVELPLNATEDRVVGTIRVDSLMKSGEAVFAPGILAEADGNILYVDEVNLLEDHIVDLLLDAAATGVCHVERDGFSHQYPARFMLVGTMNPEEGTLRPQLLDRFGLSVRVSGTLERSERLTLLERHIDFEADPVGFRARFATSESELADRIAKASALYPTVEYPAEMAEFAAGICDEIGVDGYRADLVIMRTARAAAAFDGRTKVELDDVVLAARFALPHRMKKLPFEEIELTETMLAKAVQALCADDRKEPGEPGDQHAVSPVGNVQEADAAGTADVAGAAGADEDAAGAAKPQSDPKKALG